MPRKATLEEIEAFGERMRQDSETAQEKGEIIRKTLEPMLIEQGYTGCHVYVDVHTGRHVIGRDYEEAGKKAAKELGENQLCWGFDIGVPPQIRIG